MTPAHSRCFPGAKSHRRTDDRASSSLRLVTSALVASARRRTPPSPPSSTGVRLTHPQHLPSPRRWFIRRSKFHRRAPPSAKPNPTDQIPPARGLQRLTSPRFWYPQKQIPPAHATVTSILAASAKPNPTGVRLTPARSRCFPGAKSYRRSDPLWTKPHRRAAKCHGRSSFLEPNPVSLRLRGPNPTGARAPPVTSALVASAEANPTGARRRHLHPCRLRQAKSHRRTADPSSFSLLSWSQSPPAHRRPRLVIAAPLWTKLTGARPPAPPVTSALVAIQPAPSPTVKIIAAIQPALARPFPRQRRLRGMLQT